MLSIIGDDMKNDWLISSVMLHVMKFTQRVITANICSYSIESKYIFDIMLFTFLTKIIGCA